MEILGNKKYNMEDLYYKVGSSLSERGFSVFEIEHKDVMIAMDSLRDYFVMKLREMGVTVSDDVSILEAFSMLDVEFAEDSFEALAPAIHYLLMLTGVSPTWEVKSEYEPDSYSFVMSREQLKNFVTSTDANMVVVFAALYSYLTEGKTLKNDDISKGKMRELKNNEQSEKQM